MDDKEKYIEALKKRALGYEYEEVQTLIEETAHGTKKKIVKIKKHIPADVETAKYLLRQLEPSNNDFKEMLKDFDNQIKGVIDNGNKNNKDQ